MTNIDRAAELLWLPEPHLSSSECDDQARELAQALADARLLMPDLPEPTEPEGGKWEVDEDVYVVDMSSSSLAEEDRLPGYVALVLKWSDEVKIQVMSVEAMRRVGLCLLAAADYAERNQE